jgi:hypothetical protein
MHRLVMLFLRETNALAYSWYSTPYLEQIDLYVGDLAAGAKLNR